jgi:hypothetical protein
MIKDIPNLKVENLIVAICPDSEDPSFWQVHLINLYEDPIENIIISSRGYGIRDENKVETNTLRYYLQSLSSLQFEKIELLSSEVLDITNEYWISFQLKGIMYDKKYRFVPGAIEVQNFTPIPFLNQSGVMIR